MGTVTERDLSQSILGVVGVLNGPQFAGGGNQMCSGRVIGVRCGRAVGTRYLGHAAVRVVTERKRVADRVGQGRQETVGERGVDPVAVGILQVGKLAVGLICGHGLALRHQPVDSILQGQCVEVLGRGRERSIGVLAEILRRACLKDGHVAAGVGGQVRVPLIKPAVTEATEVFSIFQGLQVGARE